MTNLARNLALLITLLALVALGLAGYLSWVTWQQTSVAGCSGRAGLDCNEVLASSWSKWLGIPVSLLAVVTYVGILALVWPVAAGKRGWVATALFTLTLGAAGAAVWFVGTQAILLNQFCIYCCSAHVCGIVIVVATYFLLQSTASANHIEQMGAMFGVAQPRAAEIPGDYHPLVAAGLASLGLVALIAGQFFFVPDSMEFVANEDIALAGENEQSPEDSPSTAEPASMHESEEPADQDSTGESAAVTEDVSDETLPDDDSVAETEESTAGEAETSEFLDESDEFLFEEDPSNQASQAELPDDGFASASGGERLLRYSAFKKPIKVTDEPLLGHADAQEILVEMLDYTCPHCRRMHPFIMAAKERYGDQLAIVVLHVPLSRKCNPEVKRERTLHKHACDYARYAITVWEETPERFAEYHDYLMRGEKPPADFRAKNQAARFAGIDALIDKRIEDDVTRRVRLHVNELARLKVGLPVLVTSKGILRGVPKSEAEWFSFCEKTLGLTPVESGNL